MLSNYNSINLSFNLKNLKVVKENQILKGVKKTKNKKS